MLDRFPKALRNRKFLIKTFWGKEVKHLREVNLGVRFSDSYHSVSFLMDDSMDILSLVDKLNFVIRDLMNQNVKLAANFSELRNDTLLVYGLLGMGVLRFLGPMNLNSFREGHVWEFP